MEEATQIAPESTATAAPENPGAPDGGQTAAQGQAQTPQEDLVQVQRGQFAPWGGDYHQAVQRAKQYDQLEADGWLDVAKELGVSGKEFLSYWNAPAQQTGQTQTPEGPANPPAEGGQGEGEKPLTREELAALLDERDQKQTEAQKKAAQQKERQEAFKAEREASAKAAQEAGFEPEVDGKPNRLHGVMAAAFDKVLSDIIAEGLPDHWSDDRKREAMTSPATAEQIKAAQERFSEAVKDLGNTFTSKAQKAKEGQPPTSLGGGASGDEPPTPFHEMTHQQKREFLKSRVRDRRAQES